MKQQYIGITGFMTIDEIKCVQNMVADMDDIKVMIGILASEKTLKGLDNKYPHRYPKVESIKDLLVADEKFLNIIHYSTDHPKLLGEQLEELAKLGGRRLDGFQLNVAWPDPEIIKKFHSVHPGKILILQVGIRAIEECGNAPKKVCQKIIDEYLGLVDYILLDPSGGLGKRIKSDGMMQFLHLFDEMQHNIGLVIAGGLCSKTFGFITPIVKRFPCISIDAEARLRDKDDHLDLAEVEKYLKTARDIFDKEQKATFMGLMTYVDDEVVMTQFELPDGREDVIEIPRESFTGRGLEPKVNDWLQVTVEKDGEQKFEIVQAPCK